MTTPRQRCPIKGDHHETTYTTSRGERERARARPRYRRGGKRGCVNTSRVQLFGPASALFAETDASTNSVISYRQASDGTISFAGSYLTGGTVRRRAGATADPLASQDGLVLANNGANLLAVNPGSDTVTVFSVQGTHLSAVQQVPSGGLFPDSIATSGRFVAVLNAGGAGSVAEFQWFNGQLVPLPGQVRSLGLANTPLPDFHHGAGQVSYTPNGQHLIVTTKLSTNAYDVFSVGFNGALGAAFTPKRPQQRPAVLVRL